MKSGKAWVGESTGEVSPADRQQWDLREGKSRSLAEQTLVRVCTRLTTGYQKLHLLQEITDKLFKP